MKKSFHINRQQGATLIVALILLALMTVVGLSAMDSSTVDVKVIANAKDRQLAFNGAESTLFDVVNEITTDNCELDSASTPQYVGDTFSADAGFWSDKANWTLVAMPNTSLTSDYIIEAPIEKPLNDDITIGKTGAKKMLMYYQTTVKSSGPGAANVTVRSHIAQKLLNGRCS